VNILGLMMIGPDHDEIAREAQESADTLVDRWVVIYPQDITDFSAQRNSLFDVAAATDDGWMNAYDFSWAMMLDTDERIRLGDGADKSVVRDWLQSVPEDVLMVHNVDGSYEKERFFRLPVRGHYVGPTHEAFITDPGATRGTLSADLITFTELPKTPEQYRAKAERDVRLLTNYLTDHPDDPRWWYYLGDTWAGLGDVRYAIDAFWHCWSLNGWDEESAWAAYRSAELEYGRGMHNDALINALHALHRRPDHPEACWLAGLCCYQMGNFTAARVWAFLAEQLITFSGEGEVPPRIGFRKPDIAACVEDLHRWVSFRLGDGPHPGPVEKSFNLVLRETQQPRRLIVDPITQNEILVVDDQPSSELDAPAVEAEGRAGAQGPQRP
jgi:tetratricopeptide (TPR) repeat protein